MKWYIIIILVVISSPLFGQNQTTKIQLTAQEYDDFPQSGSVLYKVITYYESLFEESDYLANESQKALVSFYRLEDMMDNEDGILGFLLETNSELNKNVRKALEVSGNEEDTDVFDVVIKIFEEYENDFLNHELPPELDEHNLEFDNDQAELLDELQGMWNNNERMRYKIFLGYLADIKDDLIVIKQ